MTKPKVYKNNGSAALPVYPIRTVARLTGISEGSLRAWEARYGLIKPARTKGGHRLYSDNDVGRLNEIKRLLHADGLSMAGVQVIMSEKRKAGNG
jgi:MerR family transcriptional regulator, light-induced transcriptional regulator